MNPIRKAVIPVAGLGTRHFPASHANSLRNTIRLRHSTSATSTGLKARHVIARPEGPGSGIARISRGLKGRHNFAHVPALQAGGESLGTHSRGFTPGYHMSGFQPYTSGAMNDGYPVPFPQVVTDLCYQVRNPVPGLKARHVIARPEGPGKRPPKIPLAL